MSMSFFFLCYCHLVAKKTSVLKCALGFMQTNKAKWSLVPLVFKGTQQTCRDQSPGGDMNFADV